MSGHREVLGPGCTFVGGGGGQTPEDAMAQGSQGMPSRNCVKAWETFEHVPVQRTRAPFVRIFRMRH